MDPQTILAHADSGTPWPADGDLGFPDLSSAYRTALAVRNLRIARGETPRGYKVGFTNRMIWSRYEVFAPIWGSVWDTSLSFCEGAGTVSLDHLCQPRIEPEAAFGFKATPAAGASLGELVAALDWVAPAFEVVQSHLPDWKFTAPQTVADAGLHGRLLIGQRVPVTPLAHDAGQLDRTLARARVGLHRNGVAIEEGAGANVLGGPLHALMHFLVELRASDGAMDVAPGDVVTTGTWTDAWPGQAGERWSARFDAALPSLEVAFQ